MNNKFNFNRKANNSFFFSEFIDEQLIPSELFNIIGGYEKNEESGLMTKDITIENISFTSFKSKIKD